MLNKAKDYYKIQKRDEYRNASEEEKNKKKRIWEKQIPRYV